MHCVFVTGADVFDATKFTNGGSGLAVDATGFRCHVCHYSTTCTSIAMLQPLSPVPCRDTHQGVKRRS